MAPRVRNFDTGPDTTLPHALYHNASPDIRDTLPAGARDRLQRLRQRVDDLRKLGVEFDLRHDAMLAKTESEQRLKKLQMHPSSGGYGLPPTDARVVAAQEDLERRAAEAARLSELHEVRSQAWTRAGRIRALDDSGNAEPKGRHAVI
jgi:hypothetical protein